MNFAKHNLLIGASLLCLAISGKSFGKGEDQLQLAPASARALAETIHILQDAYVDPLSQKEFERKLFSGILSKFDAHSSYLSPDDYKSFIEDMSGRYAGIGIIASKPKPPAIGVEVAEVHPSGPAKNAGLEDKDVLVEADGHPLNGTISENIKHLKGPPGSTVKVKILRQGISRTLSIRRDFIEPKSVFSNLCECGEKILFVKLTAFHENTASDLLAILTENMPSKPKAIILDLRDNPGGSLTSSIDISAIFLGEGVPVVSTKERRGEPKTYKSDEDGATKELLPQIRALHKLAPEILSAAKLPVTILMNSGSASASEILAAALQEHKRSKIVGEKTFGKGSVQRMIPLSNGGAVKVTIARYYTPLMKSIQANGVAPDIETIDSRPWKSAVLNRAKETYAAKIPTEPSREKNLDNHLSAEFLPEEIEIKKLENDAASQSIDIQSSPFEKKFSYHPFYPDGTLDSITAAALALHTKLPHNNQPIVKEIQSLSSR